MKPPIPSNEKVRVAALRAYDILDTVEEDIFDAVTRAAAQACATPMAFLNFIDADRQWCKSRVGAQLRETKRDIAICAHAIMGSKPFIVQDTLRDERFNRLSAGKEHPPIRFYAGIPLINPDGFAVGTLCVGDTVPRHLTDDQTEILKVLANNALRIMGVRRSMGMTVFARAVDVASDGITIAAPSGIDATIIYANESFLRFTRREYHQVINQLSTFPFLNPGGDVEKAYHLAHGEARMATAECRFEDASGAVLWDRVTFVPYIDDHGVLIYIVAIHRDVTAEKELELQSQQLHAMRTTLATVEHVIRNFMNTARLYSVQACTGQPVGAETQDAFDAAMEKTRHQLSAISGMTTFKDRPTPFGVSILDTENKD